MKQLKQVTEFMELMDQPILDSPQIPDKKRTDLRVELIEEETKELVDAIKDGNIIEVADALGDILYVTLGAVNEFGLGKVFEKVFDEIQRSNMSKACVKHEHAIDTLNFYESIKGVLCKIEEKNGKYLVRRLMDDKQLKCLHSYSGPNLKKILDN